MPQLKFVGSPPFARAHSFARTVSVSPNVWLFALRMICEFGAMPRSSGCVLAIAPATVLACPPSEFRFLPLQSGA